MEESAVCHFWLHAQTLYIVCSSVICPLYCIIYCIYTGYKHRFSDVSKPQTCLLSKLLFLGFDVNSMFDSMKRGSHLNLSCTGKTLDGFAMDSHTRAMPSFGHGCSDHVKELHRYAYWHVGCLHRATEQKLEGRCSRCILRHGEARAGYVPRCHDTCSESRAILGAFQWSTYVYLKSCQSAFRDILTQKFY